MNDITAFKLNGHRVELGEIAGTSLHPIFAEALRGFTPPPASNEVPPQRAYIVTIKRGAEVVNHFEAFGPDSVTVAERHQGLCKDGEYIRVRSLAEPDCVTNSNSAAYSNALRQQQQREANAGTLWPTA